MTLEYTVGNVESEARGSGARASGGKTALTLIPLHLLAGAARVFMGGKFKYAEWNWAKGMPWSEPANCLLRHFIKWWYLREEEDPESGENHLDYLMCNLLMLLHYRYAYKEGDDRPDPDLTGFPEGMEYFSKLFDEVDFLERNPAIKEKLDQKKNTSDEQSVLQTNS